MKTCSCCGAEVASPYYFNHKVVCERCVETEVSRDLRNEADAKKQEIKALGIEDLEIIEKELAAESDDEDAFALAKRSYDWLRGNNRGSKINPFIQRAERLRKEKP